MNGQLAVIFEERLGSIVPEDLRDNFESAFSMGANAAINVLASRLLDRQGVATFTRDEISRHLAAVLEETR